VIVVAREALVDLVPKPGGLLYQGYAGGSPANTAVTIARLGRRSRCWPDWLAITSAGRCAHI